MDFIIKSGDNTITAIYNSYQNDSSLFIRKLKTLLDEKNNGINFLNFIFYQNQTKVKKKLDNGKKIKLAIQ